MDTDAGADGNTVKEFTWWAEQRKIINDYCKYLQEDYARVQQFRIDPFVKKTRPNRPTHPKSLLPAAGGPCENKKLVGEELNTYLKTNCVTSDQVDWPVDPQSGFSNLQEIKKYLQQGSLAIKQQQRKILGFYIDYGQWLIKARAWYELESDGGTWKQWLKRMLTSPQHTVAKYKQFQTFFTAILDFQRPACLSLKSIVAENKSNHCSP